MWHFLKSSRGNFLLKTTALFLSSVLILPSPAQASSFPLLLATEIQDVHSFTVPSEWGDIRDSYFTPDFDNNAPLIIHIQDAHGQFEAQEHIKKLLQYLEREMGIHLALVEGASTPLSSELFNIFPDREFNKKIAETLARRAEFSGIELFLLDSNSKRDFRAVGIEEPSLYRDNFNTFKKVYQQRSAAEQFLTHLENRLDQAVDKMPHNQLKSFLSMSKQFDEGNVDLLDFARRLAREANDCLHIDVSEVSLENEWPQLQKLLLLDKVEKKVNEHETGREYKKLAELLRASGASPKLIGSFENLQSNGAKGDARAILEKAFDHIRDKSFSFLDYPNFRNFAATRILREELDNTPLYAELLRLSDMVFARLAKTETEKEMVRLSSELDLLRDFMRLELTREGYDLYRLRKENLQPEVLDKRLDAVTGNPERIRLRLIGSEIASPLAAARSDRLNVIAGSNDVEGDKAIPLLFRDVEHFYEVAEKRESVFMEKALAVMSSTGKKRAAIIAGGFHTEGLAKLLKAREISYVVISPRMEAVDSRSNYLAALTDARVSGPGYAGGDDRLNQKSDSSLADIIKSVPYESWESTIRSLGGDPDETRRQVWQAVSESNVPERILSGISNHSILAGYFSKGGVDRAGKTDQTSDASVSSTAQKAKPSLPQPSMKIHKPYINPFQLPPDGWQMIQPNVNSSTTPRRRQALAHPGKASKNREANAPAAPTFTKSMNVLAIRFLLGASNIFLFPHVAQGPLNDYETTKQLLKSIYDPAFFVNPFLTLALSMSNGIWKSETASGFGAVAELDQEEPDEWFGVWTKDAPWHSKQFLPISESMRKNFLNSARPAISVNKDGIVIHVTDLNMELKTYLEANAGTIQAAYLRIMNMLPPPFSSAPPSIHLYSPTLRPLPTKATTPVGKDFTLALERRGTEDGLMSIRDGRGELHLSLNFFLPLQTGESGPLRDLFAAQAVLSGLASNKTELGTLLKDHTVEILQHSPFSDSETAPLGEERAGELRPLLSFYREFEDMWRMARLNAEDIRYVLMTKFIHDMFEPLSHVNFWDKEGFMPLAPAEREVLFGKWLPEEVVRVLKRYDRISGRIDEKDLPPIDVFEKAMGRWFLFNLTRPHTRTFLGNINMKTDVERIDREELERLINGGEVVDLTEMLSSHPPEEDEEDIAIRAHIQAHKLSQEELLASLLKRFRVALIHSGSPEWEDPFWYKAADALPPNSLVIMPARESILPLPLSNHPVWNNTRLQSVINYFLLKGEAADLVKLVGKNVFSDEKDEDQDSDEWTVISDQALKEERQRKVIKFLKAIRRRNVSMSQPIRFFPSFSDAKIENDLSKKPKPFGEILESYAQSLLSAADFWHVSNIVILDPLPPAEGSIYFPESETKKRGDEVPLFAALKQAFGPSQVAVSLHVDERYSVPFPAFGGIPLLDLLKDSGIRSFALNDLRPLADLPIFEGPGQVYVYGNYTSGGLFVTLIDEDDDDGEFDEPVPEPEPSAYLPVGFGVDSGGRQDSGPEAGETVFAGETVEAFRNAREKMEERRLERARKSHEKYALPLISSIPLIVDRDEKSIFLVRQGSESQWSLLEQESVLGEDYADTAFRAVQQWFPSHAIMASERIGLASQPDRVENFYVYSTITKITLQNSSPSARLPERFSEGRFFPISELSKLEIHTNHKQIIDRFAQGRRLDDYSDQEIELQLSDAGHPIAPAVDKEKKLATQVRHKNLSHVGKTQPIFSVQGITELYDAKGSYRGILLVKRKKGTDAGSWDTPGGYPAIGESLPNAALREVFEEAGVRGKMVRDFYVTEKRHNADERTDYWSAFFIVRSHDEPHADQDEVDAYQVIASLDELRQFAQQNPILWDNYTVLLRYLSEREGKVLPKVLADSPLVQDLELGERMSRHFDKFEISPARKRMIREAMNVLAVEIRENKNGFLWGYDPSDRRYALNAPLLWFLAEKLQEAMRTSDGLTSEWPVRFVRLGTQDVVDPLANGGPAFFWQDVPSAWKDEYERMKTAGMASVELDRWVLENLGIYRRKRPTATSATDDFETWYWVFGHDKQFKEMRRRWAGQEATALTLFEAALFAYTQRNANAFVLLDRNHPVFLSAEKLRSSHGVAEALVSVPVPKTAYLHPNVQLLLDNKSSDTQQVLGEIAGSILSGRPDVFPATDRLLAKKRLEMEIFRILFVTRFLEILPELAVHYPIADRHGEIIKMLDAVAQTGGRDQYPVLILNFDPHHDKYRTHGRILSQSHDHDWATIVEERKQAVVSTVVVADGEESKGGVRDSKGEIQPPRGTWETYNFSDFGSENYHRLAELKDLEIPLPDGSKVAIQNYPGQIWLSLDYDFFSFEERGGSEPGLWMNQGGLHYHLDAGAVADQFDYLLNYLNQNGIKIREAVAFRSPSYLSVEHATEEWKQTVDHQFLEFRRKIIKSEFGAGSVSGFGAARSNRLVEMLSLNGDVLHARLHQLRAQERHRAPKGDDAIALFRQSQPGEAFLLSRLPTQEEWYRLKGAWNGLQHSTLDAYDWNGKRWYVLTKGDFFFSHIQPFERLHALYEIHTHPSAFNLLISTALHATASRPDFKRAKDRGIPSYVELAHKIFQYGTYADGAPYKASWWKIPLTRYRWPDQRFPNLLMGPGLVLPAAGPTAHPVWSYIKRHISVWAFLFDIAHMFYLHFFFYFVKISELTIEFPQGWMKYEKNLGLQEIDRRYSAKRQTVDATEKLFLVPLWNAEESVELDRFKLLERRALTDRVRAVRAVDGLNEQIRRLDQELGGYDKKDKGFGSDEGANSSEVAVQRFHIDRAIFGSPVHLNYPETTARPLIVKQRDWNQAIIAKHYSRAGDRFNIYVDTVSNQWHAVRLKGRIELRSKPLSSEGFPSAGSGRTEYLERAFLGALMPEAIKPISEKGKLTSSYISFDYSRDPYQGGVWAQIEGTKRIRIMSLPPTARRMRQIQTFSNGRIQGALNETLGMLRLLTKHPELKFYWLGYDQREGKFTVHDVSDTSKKKITLAPGDPTLPFDGTEMADYFALDPGDELVVIGEDGRHTVEQLVRKNVNAMALLANTLGEKLYFYFDRIEGANPDPSMVARKIIETAVGRGLNIPEEMMVMFEHSYTGEAGMFMVESGKGLHFTDAVAVNVDRRKLDFDLLVKKFDSMQRIRKMGTPPSGFGTLLQAAPDDNSGEISFDGATPANLKEQFGTRKLDSTDLRKIATVLGAQKVFYPDAFEAIQEMRRLRSAQEWGRRAPGDLVLAYKIKNNGRWAFQRAGLKFKQEKIRSLKRHAFVTSLTRDAGELRFLGGRVWFSAKKLIPQLSEEYPDRNVRRELKALLENPDMLEKVYHGAPAVVYVVDGVPVAADLFRNDQPSKRPLRIPFSLVFQSSGKFLLADSFYSVLSPGRLERVSQAVVVKRFDRFKSISYGGRQNVINKGKSSRFDYAGHIGLVGHRGLRPVWAAIAKKENPASYLVPPVEYSIVFTLSDRNTLRPVMSYERNLKAARMRTFKNHVIMTRLTKEGRLVLGGRTWGRFTHYRDLQVLVRLLNGVPVSVRFYDQKGAHKIGEESLALIYKRAVAGGPFTLVHSFHRHAFPRKARGAIKFLSSPNGTFIPLHSDQGLIVVKKLSEKGALALGDHVWIQLDERFGGWPAFIEIKDGAVVSKGLFARGTDIASLHGSSRLPIVLIRPTRRRAEKLLRASSGFGTGSAAQSERTPLRLLAGFDHRQNVNGRLSLHSYAASRGVSEEAVIDVMRAAYDIAAPALIADERMLNGAPNVDAARWTEHILIKKIRETLGLTEAAVEKTIESYGKNSYLLNTGKLSTKPQVLITDFEVSGNKETVEELAQNLPKGSIVIMFMNQHSGAALGPLLSSAGLSGITVERVEGFVNEKDVRLAFQKYAGRVVEYQKKLFISSAHAELLKRDLQAGDVLAFEFDAALIPFRRAAVRLAVSLGEAGEALRTPAGDLPLSFENFGRGRHAFLTPYFAKLTELLLKVQVSTEVRKAA